MKRSVSGQRVSGRGVSGRAVEVRQVAAWGVLLVGAAASGALGQSADWTVSVGGNPARNGLSSQTGPAEKAPAWSGGASAIIATQGGAWGTGFFCDRWGQDAIFRYDLETGAEVWRKTLPAVGPDGSRFSAVRDGVVYAHRSNDQHPSYLWALDAATGAVLWQSADKIDLYGTESVTFASNGDIIANNFSSIARIRRTDGATLWSTPRTTPASGGAEVAVHGERGYFWQAASPGPRVWAMDLATGAKLYSVVVSGSFATQLGLMVGPDGTIYVPGFSYTALVDTGSALTVKWTGPATPTSPFGTHAVGPDGSVYAYTATTPPSVVRLDAATGAVLNQSAPIATDFWQPRIAVDAAGRVYLTNGGFSDGRLDVFNADLTPRWSEAIRNVNVGGPVLGSGGTLVVCGTGSNIRAYREERCRADLNGDGLVDFADYLEFLNLYDGLDPRADLNGDGIVDFADYLEFLNDYDAGC